MLKHNGRDADFCNICSHQKHFHFGFSLNSFEAIEA